MSIEFNAIINQAINNALVNKKNSAGLSARLLTDDDIAKSLEASGRGAELSVEDLGKASKAQNQKKKIEDSYIIGNQVVDRKLEEDQQNLAEQAGNINNISRKVHNQINKIQASTQYARGRQEQVANSLGQDRANPFNT